MEQAKEEAKTDQGFDPWQVEYAEQNDLPSIGKLMGEKAMAPLQSVNKKHHKQKAAKIFKKGSPVLAIFKGSSMNLGNFSFQSEYPKALIKEMIELVQQYEKALRNKDLRIQELESMIESGDDLGVMWPEDEL